VLKGEGLIKGKNIPVCRKTNKSKFKEFQVGEKGSREGTIKRGGERVKYSSRGGKGADMGKRNSGDNKKLLKKGNTKVFD